MNGSAGFCQLTAVDDREQLKSNAWIYSWPGGILHLNIFHDGRTARFLLLKTAHQSPLIREFLKLDDSQLKTIHELRLLSSLEDVEARGMEHAFDEELMDPEYFAFLSDDQKARLDALAIQLEGYSAVLRQSVHQRLNLSGESRTSIAKLFEDMRRDYIHLRGRQNFAAQLPKDYDYEEVWWQASTTTFVNLRIIDILTDSECRAVAQFLNDFHVSIELRRELRNLCVLPNGVLSLDRFSREDK